MKKSKDKSVFVARTSPLTLQKDIARCLDSMKFSDIFSNDTRTILKINGNFDKVYPGSNTSLWFMDSFLNELIINRGFIDVCVVEGDLPLFKAEDMIIRTGMKKVLDKYNVDFIAYENSERNKSENPKIFENTQVINIPVPHSHGLATISCATKNLFGILPVDRRKYHPILTEKLLELYKNIKMFTIVDGTVGLDGESTRRGNPRRMDLILSGWDALTIDAIVANIMGFELEEVPLLKKGVEEGLLEKNFTLLGDYSINDLPRFDFSFEVSNPRKLAMFLESTFLEKSTIFLFFEHKLRRLFHNYSYLKNKKKLFNGDWMEYSKSKGGSFSSFKKRKENEIINIMNREYHNKTAELLEKKDHGDERRKYVDIQRFNKIYKHLPQNQNLRVLDLACGSGVYTFLLKKKYKYVVGVDISKEMIKLAKENSIKENIESPIFMVGNGCNLPFKNNSFDIVISILTLEHIPYPEEMLNEFYRVSKSNGNIVIIIPNLGVYWLQNVGMKLMIYLFQKRIVNSGKINRTDLRFDEKERYEPPYHNPIYREQLKKYLIDCGFASIKIKADVSLLPQCIPKRIQLNRGIWELERILINLPIIGKCAGIMAIANKR
jgi:SAM-dependent methyltransferase